MVKSHLAVSTSIIKFSPSLLEGVRSIVNFVIEFNLNFLDWAYILKSVLGVNRYNLTCFATISTKLVLSETKNGSEARKVEPTFSTASIKMSIPYPFAVAQASGSAEFFPGEHMKGSATTSAYNLDSPQLVWDVKSPFSEVGHSGKDTPCYVSPPPITP